MSSDESNYGDPETRERILRAAWELVEAQGTGVRLTDVAGQAGVSRQAVYLHFGGRTGLLVALVKYMDEALGLGDLGAHVFAAPTGIEALDRMIELHSIYAPRIDAVARMLEAAHHDDEAVAAAWRNRMQSRLSAHRAIVQRIADEGGLADGWTVDAAADLFYTITMPGPWRELTRELGWTADEYRERLARLLHRAFIAE